MKNPHRKLFVLASLVTVLTGTSALLLALAPPQQASDAPAYDNLWATGSDDSGSQLTNAIFNTHVAANPGRWKFIFIHQTNTLTGNSITLAAAPGGLGDHFLIGNGHGCPDGQIEMCQRWIDQISPAAPVGISSIDPACISIGIVGNFSVDRPTDSQLRRLTQLVTVLQSQLGIGADRVVFLPQAYAAAGIGRLFPQNSLRQQLLP